MSKKHIILHEIGGGNYRFDTVGQCLNWLKAMGKYLPAKNQSGIDRYIDNSEFIHFKDISGRQRFFLADVLFDMDAYSENERMEEIKNEK